MLHARRTYKVWVWLMVFISLPVLVFGASGASCEDAIPVQDGDNIVIDEAGIVWFTAWTYDLPLTMVFVPDNQSTTAAAPIATFDFSCDGVYDDEILNRFFNPHNPSHFVIPKYQMERKMEDDLVKYVLSVPITYRDLLAKAGLTKNLQVYVSINFPESGAAEIESNSQYTTCLTGGPVLKLNSKMDVAARDTDAYGILPFSSFNMDSINYEWKGDSPATVWMMADCSSVTEGTPMETFILQPNTPLYLTMEEVRAKRDYYESKNTEGGLVFMHVTSESEGEISINRTPMAPAEEGAILLRFGEPFSADSTKLYFFPKTWADAISFVTDSRYAFRAYFLPDGKFQTTDPIKTTYSQFKSYYPCQFSPVGSEHELDLSEMDLQHFRNNNTKGNYIYVRFATNDPNAKITLWEWGKKEEGQTQKAYLYRSSFYMPFGRQLGVGNNIYRIRMSDFADENKIYNLTATYYTVSNPPVTFYIAKKFGSSFTKNDEDVILFYDEYRGSKKKDVPIPMDKFKNCETDNGFVYMVYKGGPNTRSNVMLVTDKPAEVDPDPGCEKTIRARVDENGHGKVAVSKN